MPAFFSLNLRDSDVWFLFSLILFWGDSGLRMKGCIPCHIFIGICATDILLYRGSKRQWLKHLSQNVVVMEVLCGRGNGLY